MKHFNTREFWHDLESADATSSRSWREGGGDVLNHEVVWKTKQGEPIHVLISYPQVAYRGRPYQLCRRQASRLGLRYHCAEEAPKTHASAANSGCVEAIESISEGFAYYDSRRPTGALQLLSIARCSIPGQDAGIAAGNELSKPSSATLRRARRRRGCRRPGRGMDRQPPASASQPRPAAGAAAQRRTLGDDQRTTNHRWRHGRGLFGYFRTEAAGGKSFREIGGARERCPANSRNISRRRSTTRSSPDVRTSGS